MRKPKITLSNGEPLDLEDKDLDLSISASLALGQNEKIKIKNNQIIALSALVGLLLSFILFW
jgi:hypothetical protein